MGGIMFTDRFIKLPIKVYDVKIKELTGSCDYEDSWIKILPTEISEYKPSIDDEIDNSECTSVKMKNGDTFFVYLKSDEFENSLNEHYKKALCRTE
jgi:hypothetical protein